MTSHVGGEFQRWQLSGRSRVKPDGINPQGPTLENFCAAWEERHPYHLRHSGSTSRQADFPDPLPHLATHGSFEIYRKHVLRREANGVFYRSGGQPC